MVENIMQIVAKRKLLFPFNVQEKLEDILNE